MCGAIAAANFNFAQCAALTNAASIVKNVENIGHARANQVCARNVDFAHNIHQQLAHLAKADIDKCGGLAYVSGVDVRGINLGQLLNNDGAKVFQRDTVGGNAAAIIWKVNEPFVANDQIEFFHHGAPNGHTDFIARA